MEEGDITAWGSPEVRRQSFAQKLVDQMPMKTLQDSQQAEGAGVAWGPPETLVNAQGCGPWTAAPTPCPCLPAPLHAWPQGGCSEPKSPKPLKIPPPIAGGGPRWCGVELPPAAPVVPSRDPH